MNPLLDHFMHEVTNNDNYVGDVLEFGTGSGSTAKIMSRMNKNIFTFDGFVGLPETKKKVPTGTGWQKGNLKFDEETTRNLLASCENVKIFKEMSYNLRHPREYGIDKICGANLDFDLYEGTLDALRFIDKCSWKTILLRFDDWGYYKNTLQIKEEVEAHEQAAFHDFIKETKYKFIFYDHYALLCDNKQSIIRVSR